MDRRTNSLDLPDAFNDGTDDGCLSGARTTGHNRKRQPKYLSALLCLGCHRPLVRSEEHTSELQSLMRISYAVFCLKKKNRNKIENRRHKQYTRIKTIQLTTHQTH